MEETEKPLMCKYGPLVSILHMNLCNIVAQLHSRGKDKCVSGGLFEKEREKMR